MAKDHWMRTRERDNEWVTPAYILDAAREMWGHIGLDPASSNEAQAHVRADRHFTAGMNGLTLSWAADTVWLNPPFSRVLMDGFIYKLIAEWHDGAFREALVLTNNTTQASWAQLLAYAATSACLLNHKVRFLKFDEQERLVRPPTGPMQGQIIWHFAAEATPAFERAFGRHGVIVSRRQSVRPPPWYVGPPLTSLS